MANKPFDQRVINQLERPTSSDLNIAQSQLNLGGRALMRQLLQQNALAVGTGSLGESFFVEKIAGDRSFKIKRGVGFNYAAYNAGSDLDIDGILGLSDPFDYRMVSIQDDAGVPFDVEPAPASGYCRRDVVAIRCTNPSAANQLTDQEPTDIYDTFTNAFGTSSVDKTFTYDISGATPQVLNYNEIASATASVVYIKGQVISYNTPDDLLNAPAPVLGPTYINIAIINVVGDAAAVAQSDVVDFRRLVAPQGNLVVSGSATIGADAGLPGKALSGVTLKTPPGIKAQIWKFGNGVANSYALVVYGPRNVTSASAAFLIGADADAYDDLAIGVGSGWSVNPTQIVRGSALLNQGVTSAAKTTAASSSLVAPTQQVAVGQPYHIFPFTLCRVDNVTSTITEPVELTLDLNDLVIPPSPADAFPSGTYTASGGTTARTYYLNYGVGATSPIIDIDPPVYQLGTTSTIAETSSELAYTPVYTRIAGFLLPFDSLWQTFSGGVWRFSIASKFKSSFGSVSFKAAAYIYNGTTNPEDGTPVGVVEDVLVTDIPRSTSYETDQRTDFYMQVNGTGFTAGRRPYIVLYAKWSLGSPVAGDMFTVYYGGDKPAVVETHIPYSAQTTIPTSTDRWPAGVTLSPTGTGTTTVSVNVAGARQRLNSTAASFATSILDEAPTVPINFTLNLTVG